MGLPISNFLIVVNKVAAYTRGEWKKAPDDALIEKIVDEALRMNRAYDVREGALVREPAG